MYVVDGVDILFEIEIIFEDAVVQKFQIAGGNAHGFFTALGIFLCMGVKTGRGCSGADGVAGGIPAGVGGEGV